MEPQPPPVDSRSWWRVVLASLRGEPQDCTRGPLGRAVWILALPMVLEMAMESTFSIVDIYFVSHIGDAAVATIGLTEAMLTIVYAFGVGLAMATTALVARRVGEKNVDGAVRGASAAIALGLVLSIVLGLPGLLFPDTLLRWMGAPQEVIETGTTYTRLTLGGSGVVLFLYLNNAIFRGAGDPALALRTLLLANGLNIVLDRILIFGLGPIPAFGVTGAGMATLTGRSIGVAYQCWMLRRGSGAITLRGPAARVERPIVAELVRLSTGGVAQLFIATASWVALFKIVAPFGKEVLSGYSIAIRIVIFALMPAWGLSNAAATLVGQNLGAGQPARAERSVWLTGFMNMAFMCAVTATFVAFAPQLVACFTSNPPTLEVGVHALRTLSYGYVFYAWGMVIAQAFNGAGDTRTPTRINFFCFWCFQIPLAWTLAHPLGLEQDGVFWSVCIAESVIAAVAIALFRRGKWKEVQLASDVATAPSGH
ncbi:MAG: MATE family efflux transporter [Planctomycetota bacterium]|nr:MAG: MATE family efflux transporter [Planctomycetota bacterium]